MGKLPELKDCSLSLKTYTGESVKILGATDVIVQHGNQVRELPVVVGVYRWTKPFGPGLD